MDWLAVLKGSDDERLVGECRIVRPLLSLYADRVATPEQRRQVDTHIEHCAPCRQAMEFIEATHRVLTARPQAIPPPDMSYRIRAAIAASDSVRIVRRPRFTLQPAYAIAACAVIAAIGVGVLHSGLPGGSRVVALLPHSLPASSVPYRSPVVAVPAKPPAPSIRERAAPPERVVASREPVKYAPKAIATIGPERIAWTIRPRVVERPISSLRGAWMASRLETVPAPHVSRLSTSSPNRMASAHTAPPSTPVERPTPSMAAPDQTNVASLPPPVTQPASEAVPAAEGPRIQVASNVDPLSGVRNRLGGMRLVSSQPLSAVNQGNRRIRDYEDLGGSDNGTRSGTAPLVRGPMTAE